MARQSVSAQDTDDLLKTVLETVVDGLIIIDAQGIVQSFNRAAVKIFGYAPEEVIGNNVKMLMPEPYHSGHDGYMQNYLHTGEKKVIGIGREVVGKRKDNSTFPMELGINDMKIRGRHMFVGTVRDITERKQSEAYRETLVHRLSDSNTELERFAYVASHDLQEPIRMINNFGKILLDEYKDALGKEGQEYLHMVTDSGERMRDVVNDLLEYSRLDSETIRFHRFSGMAVLDGALENLRALILEQEAVITYDTLPELYGSPVQMMRVLQNLISNAIKYQAKGNVAHIDIKVQDRRDHWDIHVRDNGIGIESRFLTQIFDPFRRLHTWDQIKGSGLGLAICKKIVETNHGAITVTSTPGVGSTFTLSLPKAEILEIAV